MANEPLPTPELLRKLLRYEPDTGKLFWKERPASMFAKDCVQRSWNTRFAGAEAFTADAGRGYRIGSIFGRIFKAHRVIWAMQTGAWPKAEIDHINNKPCDNRIINLREATRLENNRNPSPDKGSTSGYLGVSWFKRDKKWKAQIRIDGVQVYLGLFSTEEDAALAYDKAARLHFGKFANPNF